VRAAFRRVRDVLVPLALLVAALWCAQLWLFHGWAAGGPPSPRPEWHRAWSARFGALMCVWLALLAAWMLRHRIARARRTA
jgi:hypothetical protein